MKWLLAISISIASLLSGTTQPANAVPLANATRASVETQQTQVATASALLTFTGSGAGQLTLLEKQSLARQKVINTTEKMKQVISYLHTRVGKTWYVFSGISPIYGWDCSGLVLWTYSNFGVTLTHSAGVEIHQGKQVLTPKVGDIVGFGWKGWGGAGHVGIYIGNGLMIHAPHRGATTTITSIAEWAKENGNNKVTYTRVVDTL
jgi:cell wall-associated NlpC family hydrolase